ncbi:DUF6221 family protein [Streptomyces sp. NPDC051453]|uniref:DUF6221 family protein n=1 Tax=Streptomyces sp. NPDC051453 TaxID=3154941 RepID=UPI00341D0B4F
MDELMQFLRDRLDEEAAEAQAAADEFGAEWTVDEAMASVRSNTGADVVEEPGTPCAHIARHDPARVLAEVEAKRRLLLWAESAEGGYHLLPVVDNLVGIYSDHPDFDPSWLED